MERALLLAFAYSAILTSATVKLLMSMLVVASQMLVIIAGSPWVWALLAVGFAWELLRDVQRTC